MSARLIIALKSVIICNMTINKFIKKRPHLVWYTNNFSHLSSEAIVEAVLNCGDWQDVQEMIKIMGIKKVTRIFKIQTNKHRTRINYHPKTIHFFKLYFAHYAQRNSHKRTNTAASISKNV